MKENDVKRMTRALLALATGAAALLAPTVTGQSGAEAHAATASYWYTSSGTSTPTVYWTNTWYAGSPYNPTKTIPAGATITSVSYSYTMGSAVPSGTALNLALCVSAGCTAENLAVGNSSSGSGATDDFDGLSADQAFTFEAGLAASSTYNLSPNYYYSSYHSIQVNYTY